MEARYPERAKCGKTVESSSAENANFSDLSSTAMTSKEDPVAPGLDQPSGELPLDDLSPNSGMRLAVMHVSQVPIANAMASWDPELAPYRGHPSLKERYFYAIPLDLLDKIEQMNPGSPASEVELEQAVSRWCDRQDSCVGIIDGRPITDNGLRPSKPLTFSNEDSNTMRISNASADLAAKKRNALKDKPFLKALSGYRGWLVTNPTFVQEHDQLLREHGAALRTHGFDAQVHRIQREVSIQMGIVDPPPLPEAVTALERFLTRWRLSRLSGPYLPVPLGPLFGAEVLRSMLSQLEAAGGMYFLPDTIPIPSRDELRDLIADSIMSPEDRPHLEDWHNLVRKDAVNKSKIQQYTRLFSLQHYWRLLRVRHPSIFRGNVGALQQIFGKHLGVTQDSIKKDLQFIRRQLGQDWEDRGFHVAPRSA